ncbi:hypothetical protein TNCV_334711 [Trichonephila clavipes]|nr:hypothetical protein TNCV_334711 [Trichonephila clavipes]
MCVHNPSWSPPGAERGWIFDEHEGFYCYVFLALHSFGSGLQGIEVGQVPVRPEHPFQLHQKRPRRMNTQRLVSQTVIREFKQGTPDKKVSRC